MILISRVRAPEFQSTTIDPQVIALVGADAEQALSKFMNRASGLTNELNDMNINVASVRPNFAPLAAISEQMSETQSTLTKLFKNLMRLSNQ